MRTTVIGSGISGLAGALYRLRAGDRVTLFEQGPQPGGVTAPLSRDGYTWDLGQLLVGGGARSVADEITIDGRGFLEPSLLD